MQKAKLIGLSGEGTGEFSGMMDYTGKLIERPGGYSFLCENGDDVTIPVKSKGQSGDVLTIKSKTGNTWKFRIIPVHVAKPMFAEDVRIRPNVGRVAN